MQNFILTGSDGTKHIQVQKRNGRNLSLIGTIHAYKMSL